MYMYACNLEIKLKIWPIKTIVTNSQLIITRNTTVEALDY